MKTIKSYLILIVLLLGSLTGNSVYAQYAPGVSLPPLGYQGEINDKFDTFYKTKGVVWTVGMDSSIPVDRLCFAIRTGWSDEETFRVSANGTVSVICPNSTPVGQKPNSSLNFYGAQYQYWGGINCSQERMAVFGRNGIYFWGTPNTQNTPNLSVNANGSVTVANAITMKIGRNGDPAIKSELNAKWLKLGGTGGIAFWGNGNIDTEDSPHVLIKENSMTVGQVTSNNYTLNVGGAIYTERDGVKTYFGRDTGHDDAWMGTRSKHGFYLGTNSLSCMYFDAEYNNAYIGLIDTSVAQIRKELKEKYTLFVAKGILSEDYSIAPRASWSDFVFNTDYALKTISEVEEFISENNHLPDVPSAKQVAEEGYSQHDMNKILLQKIEELTLYTIQQQKEIQGLKTELNNLKK